MYIWRFLVWTGTYGDSIAGLNTALISQRRTDSLALACLEIRHAVIVSEKNSRFCGLLPCPVTPAFSKTIMDTVGTHSAAALIGRAFPASRIIHKNPLACGQPVQKKFVWHTTLTSNNASKSVTKNTAFSACLKLSSKLLSGLNMVREYPVERMANGGWSNNAN